MDTTAYLHAQGWQGAGHALHGRGLSKPLLVSLKQNVLGVGKKRHDAHADQWWARAFDGCLKGLEVSRLEDETGTGQVGMSVRVEGKRGALDALEGGSGKAKGLYGLFVRGEGLSGTFGGEREGVDEVEKMAVDGEGEGAVDERRAERRQRRKEREVAEFVVMVAGGVSNRELINRRRKEEKRKRRRNMSGAKDGMVAVTKVVEITSDELGSSLQEKKRRRVEAGDDDGSPKLVTSGDHVATETSVSRGCEVKATDEENQEAVREKEKLLIKVERRRKKAVRRLAVRRALQAERNSSGDGQAGEDADKTNKTHRKKKRNHTEEDLEGLSRRIRGL